MPTFLSFRFLVTFCIILFSILSSCSKKNEKENIDPKKTYELVWSDEFEYNGLPDSTKWGYEKGYVRNQEEQYYQEASLLNSEVKDGMLTITGRYDTTAAEYPITSASITTKDRLQVLFGRLEMRAKMPKGAGAWPAFWTLGVNRDTIGWPYCGEIDVMEWLGFVPNYVFGSLHMANSEGVDAPRITPYAPAKNDLSVAFHVYAIEWDSEQIDFYFDNTLYATYKASEHTASEWAQFTKPHYMLVNLALGGKSGGNIDKDSYPFVYQVDYVRYYQQNP
ncbi:glycosyl hydrolase family 16 [Dyadobacter jejuensis]|uniref:Glycosyl hydrolase family 16 n=1 Tax=Dyadobacter jejuensis TaxID=1082580 RepID=A0A316A7E7_9BACT|nr:glycoside hydrolase family 16 protein [Dyadobacter jejuensis]PWJ52744.1 glycosyl hydrolase family 16 [Dyadobacter jejuensis]